MLRISVLQQAPVCRRLGHYSFHAMGGANTVRVPRRIHGHLLGVGTYLFVGSAAQRRVFHVRVRLARVEAGLVARRTHLADTCTPRVALVSMPVTASARVAARHTASKPEPQARPARGIGSKSRTKGGFRPPISAFNPVNAPTSLRPLVFLLLAASIGLLGTVAAVPAASAAGSRAGALVVHHRTTLAVVGIGALAAATLITVLT
jgi:hypothetical protein